MNEREFRFLRRILREFHEDIRTIRDEKETSREHPEVPSPVPVINAELQVPERIERNNQSNSDREHRLNKLLVIGTWLAFLAAAIYAAIAAAQKKTMDATFREVKEQTTLIRQQLVGTQAALLSVNADFNSGLHVSIDNSGHIAAVNTQAIIHVGQFKLMDNPLTPVVRMLQFVITAPSLPAPGYGRHEINETYTVDPALFETDWATFEHSAITTKVDIFLTYGNGFGDQISQHVCKAWLAKFNIKTKNGSTGGGGFIDCDNFAAGIQEITKLKADEAKGIYH